MAKQAAKNVTLVDATNKHQVVVMEDHMLTFPELYLDVYIAGDRYEEVAFAQLFARALCKRVKTPEEADLVVFTGGADVDPALYGEKPHESVHISPSRDTTDINLYMKCLEQGIPMLGICRGAQFGHVMNGGKLYQDVNNHYGDHKLWDNRGKCTVEKVSSVHHQAVIPHEDTSKMEIIAIALGANTNSRWLAPNKHLAGSWKDVEAFFYRDTCFFGVQGHPEYKGYNAFAKWTLDLINELFVTNPDLEWSPEKKRRLKKDIIATRDNHPIEIKTEQS